MSRRSWLGALAALLLALPGLASAQAWPAKPVKFIVGFAPGASNVSVPFGDGGAFTTAMSYAITALVPNSDTTAVNTDDLHAVITFI